MTTPKRVQAGLSTGGQFAPSAHAETDIALPAMPALPAADDPRRKAFLTDLEKINRHIRAAGAVVEHEDGSMGVDPTKVSP